jgi:hypothetical protein
MVDDLPERPGPAPAEERNELEQPVRPGYGGLLREPGQRRARRAQAGPGFSKTGGVRRTATRF